jgi:hypothetical protein
MSTGWLTSCDVSAVILAVIVIMWAVVLVPMWLRRHDAATESRSVDRFSTAMRVLSRRGSGGPDRRYVLMPRRDSQASVHVSGASAPHRRSSTRPATAAPPARPQPRPEKRRQLRASLAVRRRRALLGLGGVTLLTVVLTLAGVIGWPLQLVVDLIFVAFVVHLRTQAKRAAAVSRQRRRAAVAPAVPAPVTAPPPAAAAAPAAASAPSFERPAVEPDTSPMPAVQTAATGTDDAWQPVPVPPPTYTMKPKAPQRWTYAPPTVPGEPGALVAEPVEPAAAAAETPEPAEVGELEGILEHRWAVND